LLAVIAVDSAKKAMEFLGLNDGKVIKKKNSCILDLVAISLVKR
jgi:hypothetical protein